MIQDIIDDICTALVDTPNVVSPAEQYTGEIADVVRHARQLPALRVIYDGANFNGREVEAVSAYHTMQFTVVLIAKNHRSREDGAEACHTIIEDVRTRLIGRLVDDDIGELWPVRETLIDANGPLLVYGLSYNILTEYESS